jgi:alkylated DNA repair protein (DNA oxidative demethylase)
MQQSLNFTDGPLITRIDDGAYWLQGFCLAQAEYYWQLLIHHFEAFPLQTMMTPMGPMSVKTTSFGEIGWEGDENGYGYALTKSSGQKNWPRIPAPLLDLAARAASAAGYQHFVPDTCLVNVYEVGAKMGLHQDKDERDFSQPIVSVSLGLPATFLFGGAARDSQVRKMPVMHGDVVVWGGKSRRHFHGVSTIAPGQHPLLGALRCNLTFRKAT